MMVNPDSTNQTKNKDRRRLHARHVTCISADQLSRIPNKRNIIDFVSDTGENLSQPKLADSLVRNRFENSHPNSYLSSGDFANYNLMFGCEVFLEEDRENSSSQAAS